MKKTLTALMALGLLLLSGCATLAPSPTATHAPTDTPVPALATSADDVIGVWQRVGGYDGSSLFHQFDEDRTWRAAQRLVTNLEDSPQLLGRFTLEGGLITVVASDESPLCAGQSGTYEVRRLEQGRLGFSLVEDECGSRALVWGSGMILEPLSR